MAKDPHSSGEPTMTGPLGINALFGFIEWILLSRNQTSGTEATIFSSSPSPSTMEFAHDLTSLLLANSTVSSLVIMLGSTYLSPTQVFQLDFEGINNNALDFGKQKLSMRVMNDLVSLDSTSTRRERIHFLVCVDRQQSTQTMENNGFSVIDEDVKVMNFTNNRILYRKWNVCSNRDKLEDDDNNNNNDDDDDKCWMVWTRSLFQTDG
jgi:hypothetical protein